MITTGWPEASLLATRGSEPIDLEPTFGGRQGTRLKMSPADFATSLTLSMALPVTPFWAAGLTAAMLLVPVVAGLAASTLVSPCARLSAGALSACGLAVSDTPACCGGGVWA